MLKLLMAATLHYAKSLGCGNQLCAEKSETSLIQVHGLSQVNFPRNSTQILSSCDDGEQQIECFDVGTCAKMAPKTDKFALVTSYVGQVGPDSMPFIKSASAAAKLAKARAPLAWSQLCPHFTQDCIIGTYRKLMKTFSLTKMELGARPCFLVKQICI